MRPASRFWVRCLAFSAGLFAAWWAALSIGSWRYLIDGLGFVIPVVAIVLASVQSAQRKAAAVGMLLVLFALGDEIARLLDSGSLAQTGLISGDSFSAGFGVALYHTFRIGLPIAAVLAFTGGRMSSLWEPGARVHRPLSVCPVCGVRKVGLEEHVRDVHGCKEVVRLRRAGLL